MAWRIIGQPLLIGSLPTAPSDLEWTDGALYSVEASGQDFVIRRLLSGAGSTSLTSTLVATIDLPGQLLRTGRTIPRQAALAHPRGAADSTLRVYCNFSQTFPTWTVYVGIGAALAITAFFTAGVSLLAVPGVGAAWASAGVISSIFYFTGLAAGTSFYIGISGVGLTALAALTGATLAAGANILLTQRDVLSNAAWAAVDVSIPATTPILATAASDSLRTARHDNPDIVSATEGDSTGRIYRAHAIVNESNAALITAKAELETANGLLATEAVRRVPNPTRAAELQTRQQNAAAAYIRALNAASSFTIYDSSLTSAAATRMSVSDRSSIARIKRDTLALTLNGLRTIAANGAAVSEAVGGTLGTLGNPTTEPAINTVFIAPGAPIASDRERYLYVVATRGHSDRAAEQFLYRIQLTDLELPAPGARYGVHGQGITPTNQLPEADGGYGAITYTLTGLPAGLHFNASSRSILPPTGNAILTTTPVGTHRLTYTATDAAGVSVSRQFDLTIRAAPLAMTAPPAFTALVTDTIPTIPSQPNMPAATGGAPPYTYEITGLPPGVSGASAAGQRWYTGAAAAPGTYTPRVKVTDDDDNEIGVDGSSIIISDFDAPTLTAAVTAPTATVATGSAAVTISAVPSAERYDVRYRAAGVTTWIDLPNRTLTAVQPIALPRLTAGTTYFVQARGVHTSTPQHNGPWGSLSVVIPAQPGTPQAVTAGPLQLTGHPGDTPDGTPSGISGPGTLSYALVAPPPPNSLASWISINASTGLVTAGPLPTASSYPAFRYFQYRVSSSTPGTTPAIGRITVRINAPPTSPAPVVKDVSFTIQEGTELRGAMAFAQDADGNDQDGAGPDHTWNVSNPPAGFISSLSAPQFRWPNPTPVGETRITYSVTDSADVRSNEAEIIITVTAAPPPVPTALVITGPIAGRGRVGEQVPSGLEWNAVGGTAPITWDLPTRTSPTNRLPPGVTMSDNGRRVTAAGQFQGVVSNRRNTLTATDSQATPASDTHDVVWNVDPGTSPGPGPTPGPGEVVTPRIVLIAEGFDGPRESQVVDGVTTYYAYYGETPTIKARAYNLVVGHGGPAYRMIARQPSGLLINTPWFNTLGFSTTGVGYTPAYRGTTVFSSTIRYLTGLGQSPLPGSAYRLGNFDRRITSPPDGRTRPVVRTTEYTATLQDGRSSNRRFSDVPVYARNLSPSRPVDQSQEFLIVPGYRSSYDVRGRAVASTRIRIVWSPRPLVLPAIPDATLAAGTTPTLPVASGGIPPYRYWLSGVRPDGITAGTTWIDAAGATRHDGQDSPIIPTGAVRNDREYGQYRLYLTVEDSGIGQDRQIAEQRFLWTVPAPA